MSNNTLIPQLLQKEAILRLIQEGGDLCRLLKGFEPRLPQQQMMSNIIDAYNRNHIALIEAGTGTGKSLAYLIPALIWASQRGERTVISTNTIALQEQLLHKDIPLLTKSLNLFPKAVLVKGMNNYLCLRKLDEVQSEQRLFPSEEKPEIDKIEQWSRTTVEGSKSELPFAPSPPVWEKVGAESEACPHNQCPFYHQCFFFKARQQAQDAQILIVNHHLLFADLAKRSLDSKNTEMSILPHYKRIILDEAHHIEEIATEHFANRLNRMEVIRLLSRLTAEKHNASQGKLPILKEKIQIAFNKAPSKEAGKIITRLTIDLPALRHLLLEHTHLTFDCFAQFIENINEAKKLNSDTTQNIEQKLRLLDEHQNHPMWMSEIVPKAEKLIEMLGEYTQTLRGIESDLKLLNNERLNELTKGVRLDIQALVFRLEAGGDTINRFLSQWKDNSKVRWIEVHQLRLLMNVHLVDAELDVSEALVNFLFSHYPTIILCSATLTTNKEFSFIRQRLGITSKFLPSRIVTEHIYDSPFDYHKQALLAVPKNLPLPSHPQFNEAAFECIRKAIEASRGQSFVLFTSYQMLENCHRILGEWLKENRYPLFKQGDENRQTLLNKFKATNRAVLFGTDSFWEGVDVAGDALRCVIIVKLPFKVPSEPIIQARTESILDKGGDPFFEFSVPQAIVKFKQGFGRLIRHKWDRGCIICLDTRLFTKGYGRLFLNSLPSCEQLFLEEDKLWPKINDFYRQTYHFVKKNPFSNHPNP